MNDYHGTRGHRYGLWSLAGVAVAGGAVVAVGALAASLARLRMEAPVAAITPIHVSADVADAFNILVMANGNDFGDMSDPKRREAWARELDADLVTGKLLTEDVFKPYENHLNFWLADRTATIQSSDAPCTDIVLPDYSDLQFYPSAVLVLHHEQMWDCTQGLLSTSEVDRPATIVHELGHSVFVMPDEYCCDGAYWDAPPLLVRVAAGTGTTRGAPGTGSGDSLVCGGRGPCTVAACQQRDTTGQCLASTLAAAAAAGTVLSVDGDADQYYRGNCCVDTAMTTAGTDLLSFGPQGRALMRQRLDTAFPVVVNTPISAVPTGTQPPRGTATPNASANATATGIATSRAPYPP